MAGEDCPKEAAFKLVYRQQVRVQTAATSVYNHTLFLFMCTGSCSISVKTEAAPKHVYR